MEALKRRRTRDKSGKSTKWSDKMSPEAQIAMQLAMEDTKTLKQEQEALAKAQEDQNRSPTRVAFADEKNASNARDPSFHEIFERNGSARMRKDLTDDQYSEDSESKKALGGGKVESAMEIVEIVNHDDPDPSTALDEQAIDELAMVNSVDKCAVWIEATQPHQDQAIQPNATEANPVQTTTATDKQS